MSVVAQKSAGSAANGANDASEGGLPIALYERSPTDITFHRIEDHELEALTKLSRPLSMAVAGTATGGFLGLAVLVVGALDRVGTSQLAGTDITAIVLCAICLTVSCITWPIAIRGERRACNSVTRIRSRPLRRL